MFYSPKRKYNYENKNEDEQNDISNNNKNIKDDLNAIEKVENETRSQKLEFQNEIYNLKFGYVLNNNEIFLELYPKTIDNLQNFYYYKKSFSYNDLTKLCKSFKMYDSIQEIFSSFCIIFENKKAFLKINENNSFDIVLLVNSAIGKEEEVCLPLERINILKDNINNINPKWEEKEKELNERIDNLEKNLKQENYELKNEIYYLKTDINKYIKTIDNNKKEIKNLKEQIKNLKNSFEEKIKKLSEQINTNHKIINDDLIQDNNINENIKIQKESKENNMNSKSQNEFKTSDNSKKNNKLIHKNNIINDNQKKNNKNENKINKNQEKIKNNKREIYKQMKEENTKRLNLNKEKTSFRDFLKQKKIQDGKNKNNKQINKTYNNIDIDLFNSEKIEPKINDMAFENNEEKYNNEDDQNLNNNNYENEENIDEENENDRYKNYNSHEDDKEKNLEEENKIERIKGNETNRSYRIDEWTKDFNLNVKKLLEDNETKMRLAEKLNFMNRNIIAKIEELQLIENQLFNEYPQIKNIEYNLIYRASDDGDSSKDFHEKCNVKNNLILIQTNENIKFGGYTEENWDGENLFKKDKNAFYFYLNKNKIYKVTEEKNAIYCDEKMGPCFGDKFFQIFDNFLTKGGLFVNMDKCGYTELKDDLEIVNGSKEFSVLELEVYELKFE